MQTDVGSRQCLARQVRALVAPLVLLLAILLAVWRADPPAPSQQKTQAVEPPANNGARSSRAMPSALEPAMRDMDGVVHHG
jgi:hypothetical protein